MVASSTLAGGTKQRPHLVRGKTAHASIAQRNRASVYGTEGREFESLWTHASPV